MIKLILQLKFICVFLLCNAFVLTAKSQVSDGAVTAFNSPTSDCNLGSEPVSIILFNAGLLYLTNFDVWYSINGGIPIEEVFTDTIYPGDSLTFTFSTISTISSFGSYSFAAGIEITQDPNPFNDDISWIVENWNGCGNTCSDAKSYGVINSNAVNASLLNSTDVVWWKFSIPSSSNCYTQLPGYSDIYISLCGSSFDTKLEVYDSCASTSYSFFNNNSCGLQSEIFIWSLSPGEYYVKVEGHAGSFGDYTLQITGQQVFGGYFPLISSVSHVLCHGASTGSITLDLLSGQGGTTATLPITILWSNGASTQNINNIPAGYYSVTITDSDGCTGTESTIIIEPDEIVASLSIIDASLFGASDASIDVSVTGGVSPFSFLWSDSLTSEDQTNIPAGHYQVTISDHNQCEFIESIIVLSPLPSPTFNTNITPAIHIIQIPANVTIGCPNPPLSEGSLLGVFYDSLGVLKCGGYTFYNGNQSTLTAYATIVEQHNGFLPAETFAWKIFPADDSIAYESVATYNNIIYPNTGQFTINGSSGLVSLELLDPPMSQSITLEPGWSLWSTYLIPENPSIEVVLSDVVTPPGIPGELMITKNGTGQVYWPFYDVNLIGNLVIGEGYQSKTTTTSNLSFTISGTLIQPEQANLLLPSAWSIIAYLRTSPAPIDSMLLSLSLPPSISGGCLEIAKNSMGDVYWPYYNVNQIGNMIPGEGYQLKLNFSSSFTYPANSN
jgi:hypothetical protein